MKKLLLIALLPAVVECQTPIYRSVQPKATGAISAGHGNLTISGSTATFTQDQPDSVGVGDAIQYDATGDGIVDAICFIHGRLSASSFTVKSSLGLDPLAVTSDADWAIYRAYNSIMQCLNGEENPGINAVVRSFDLGNRNLVLNNEVWNVALYPGRDTVYVVANGWTTDPTHYIRYYTPYKTDEVGRNMRHRGVWTTRSYILDPRTNVIPYNEMGGGMANARFEGLQVKTSSGNVVEGALVLASSGINPDRRVEGCIIRGDGVTQTSSTRYCGIVASNGGSNSALTARNNIIYGFVSGNTTVDCGILIVGGQASTIYNCTIVDCTDGIRIAVSGSGHRAINNVVQGAVDGFVHTGGGTWHADSDYNVSDISGDAPGSHSVTATIAFFSPGNRNYHLSGLEVNRTGRDLSAYGTFPFNTDVDGNVRTRWNVGADEYTIGNLFRRRLEE